MTFQSAVKTPEVRAAVDANLGRLVEEYPQDLSVQIASTLLALAEGKTEAIERLTRLVEQTPLDDLPGGSRANARQRAEAAKQLGLWLVARACSAQESVRAWATSSPAAPSRRPAARPRPGGPWRCSVSGVRSTSTAATALGRGALEPDARSRPDRSRAAPTDLRPGRSSSPADSAPAGSHRAGSASPASRGGRAAADDIGVHPRSVRAGRAIGQARGGAGDARPGAPRPSRVAERRPAGRGGQAWTGLRDRHLHERSRRFARLRRQQPRPVLAARLGADCRPGPALGREPRPGP